MVKKVCILTYGCPTNVADSEIMAGLLHRNGFGLVENSEKSDLNIINTCTVKMPTEQRMIYKIRKLTETKKPLIVAGCMPLTNRKTIEEIFPQASMPGPHSIDKIVLATIATLQGRKVVSIEGGKKPKVCLPRLRKNSVIWIVPISAGCTSNCTYCSVKLARGKLFSYPSDLIVKEAKQAIQDKYKELYVTSQDNSCYGKDIGENLPDLLNKICRIQGKIFIRVGMMNPTHTKAILDKLLIAYKNKEIFKFLHLPVQSGSNRILKEMKRGYKVEDFVEMVEKFRKHFPSITIATDIIVGFPGETEEDFKKTINLVKKVRPDVVNISKFGPRPGTEAAKMEQLDRKIVNKRSGFLHKLVKKISLENNERWISWKGEILIDEKIEGGFVGRNFAYKPVILKTKENLFGKFVDVEIIDVSPNCLISRKI